MAINNITWRFAEPVEYKNVNDNINNIKENFAGAIEGVKQIHDNRIDMENASLIETEEQMEKRLQEIDKRIPEIDIELENVRNQIESMESSMHDIEGKFYNKPDEIEYDGIPVDTGMEVA